MATFDKHKEYLCRLALAEGHRKFGITAPRKEPSDDDDGGDGSSEFSPMGHAHPLLHNAAQFGGDYQLETPVIPENPDANKQLELRLEAKLDKQHQQEKHINPTPTRGM